MADGRPILVVGATGAQGGSVARHLLRRGRHPVRCLTRSPDSPAAARLRGLGAEVVQGDLDDPGSLRRALAGCWGVFGVTSYWEHFGGEYRQGVALIDAVASSPVEHLVFSSLASPNAISGGELDVPHFDIKARLEAYARGRGIPATYVHVASYFENFLTHFLPRRQEDGTFGFGFPQGDTPLAGVAVEDLGGVVAALFERHREFRGRTVGVVSEQMAPAVYAQVMTRVLGYPVAYRHVPREVYAALPFPGAADLAAMFDYNRRFVPDRAEDAALSRALFPALQGFEGWLRAHRDAFLGAMAA